MGNNLSSKEEEEVRGGEEVEILTWSGMATREQSPEMCVPRAGTHSSHCLLAPAFIRQRHEELMFAERISWAKDVPCRSPAHPRVPVGHSL